MVFNGQITYGDMFAIVLVFGMIGVVILGGVIIAVQILVGRK